MVKPHKKKRKQATQLSSPVSSLPPANQSPTAPATEAVPKGRIMRAGSRLFNSAIDSALSNIWSVIGAAAGSATMTVLIALILFFRSPESSWVYSLLKYALAYMGGFLTPVMILVALALLGVRRRRNQEKKNTSKYISKEKGNLDYRAELEPTVKSFQAVLVEIATELRNVGAISATIGASLGSAGGNPVLERKRASEGAKILNKHAQKLERSAMRLKEKTAAFLEVSQGCIKGAPHGQQQDLNTSMNWLVGVTEENIRILSGFKTRMASDLLPLLQKKLTS